jgi:hypothetical protein
MSLSGAAPPRDGQGRSEAVTIDNSNFKRSAKLNLVPEASPLIRAGQRCYSANDGSSATGKAAPLVIAPRVLATCFVMTIGHLAAEGTSCAGLCHVKVTGDSGGSAGAAARNVFTPAFESQSITHPQNIEWYVKYFRATDAMAVSNLQSAPLFEGTIARPFDRTEWLGSGFFRGCKEE